MTKQNINSVQVLIGQPIDYPNELVSLIKEIVYLNKDIKKVYLARIQYSHPGSLPKILIGLEVIGNIDQIISDLKKQTTMKKYTANMLEFTDAANGNFKSYFSEIKPFYNQEN